MKEIIATVLRSRGEIASLPAGQVSPAPVVTPLSTSSLGVSWTQATNANGYILERSTDDSTWIQIANISGTNYIDNTLSANQLRYYRVIAYNSLGNASPSASGSGTTLSANSLKAFPDASGWGQGATGGRGGQIYVVNNAQEFEDAARGINGYTSGPRYILFGTGGVYDLGGNVIMNNSNLTVFGQTAPGDGVCLTGGLFGIQEHEVIIQGLRNRRYTANSGNDCMNVVARGGETLYNIIIDKVSNSWGTDGNLDANGVKGIINTMTFQRNIAAQPCYPHALNTLLATVEQGDVLRNLFVQQTSRTPVNTFNQTGATYPDQTPTMVSANNCVFGWWGYASQASNGRIVDFLYNIYKPFPSGSGKFSLSYGGGSSLNKAISILGECIAYLEGNIMPPTSPNIDSDATISPSRNFPSHPFTVETTEQAIIDEVVDNAGAVPRDKVDAEFVQDFIEGGEGRWPNKIIDRADITTGEAGTGRDFPSYNAGSLPSPTRPENYPFPDWYLTEEGLDPAVDTIDPHADSSTGYPHIEHYAYRRLTVDENGVAYKASGSVSVTEVTDSTSLAGGGFNDGPFDGGYIYESDNGHSNSAYVGVIAFGGVGTMLNGGNRASLLSESIGLGFNTYADWVAQKGHVKLVVYQMYWPSSNVYDGTNATKQAVVDAIQWMQNNYPLLNNQVVLAASSQGGNILRHLADDVSGIAGAQWTRENIRGAFNAAAELPNSSPDLTGMKIWYLSGENDGTVSFATNSSRASVINAASSGSPVTVYSIAGEGHDAKYWGHPFGVNRGNLTSGTTVPGFLTFLEHVFGGRVTGI